MAQLLRPSGDGVGTWSVPTFSRINETVPDDTNYTSSSPIEAISPSSVSQFITVAAPASTPTGATTANTFLRYRAWNQVSGGAGTPNAFELRVRVAANLTGPGAPAGLQQLNKGLDATDGLTLYSTDLADDGAYHQFNVNLNAIDDYNSSGWTVDWTSLQCLFGWSDGILTDPGVFYEARISWLEVQVPDGAAVPDDWYKLNVGSSTNPAYVAYKSVAGGSTAPADFTLPYDLYIDGIFYPTGTTFSWVIDSAPDDNGWFLSVDEQFSGAGMNVVNSVPRDPRSFTEISSFATGTAKWFGGFPGPSCVFENHLVYAKGGYTAGTDSPPIHVFDGQFDREIVRLPNTAAGVVPKGVMSMLSANGTIYLSTLDSGTNSTNWAGRVFSLSLETGQLAPVGNDAFTSGHVPYALAWHMGRLWVGTHRQVSTATGKIYYFRPDVDTTWTEDHDLTTESRANVGSMLSYKGLLYVGTTGASGTFAQVLVRSELGAYTASKTGAGGTAAANNGFPALVEFGGNLYASFFNPDATAVSLIYKFNNTSWSTAYTGATTTLVPYIGFPTDNSILLAIGGGISYNATILTTPDGTTWSDRTAFLSQGSPASTCLPVFGVVMH